MIARCLAVLLFLAPGVARAATALDLHPYEFQTFGPEHASAELGTLRVPERHADPNGPAVTLAFVRFRSTSPHPGVPLIYLGGGIGDGITAARTIRFRFLARLLANGDVVVVDQRGSGLSRPSLACGDPYDMPLDRAGTQAAMLAAFERAASACVARLRGAGVDLGAYNVDESADDIESLRAALGAKQVDLLGISYGTTLALDVIKRHSSGIRSVVLAGVEGLDDTYKVPHQLDVALERLGPPGVTALFATALARLQKQPQSANAVDPKTGAGTAVTVGPFDLQFEAAYTAGDRYAMLRLPAQLRAIAKGDVGGLARFARGLRTGGLDSALRLTLDCASGASSGRASAIRSEQSALLGDAVNFPFPQACAMIGDPDLGPGFRSPVASTIPALFISGTIDGRTPPENADRVAAGFARAGRLIIDGAGHGDDLFSSSPRIVEVVLSFLAGGRVDDETIALPAPSFPSD
ncbi:MAG TPA: alpha/beta fold hydrolase [Candidatus Baltobacteraceae bacterium]|jgi:pimeloyl-ACP methyl ester carboxylesterase